MIDRKVEIRQANINDISQIIQVEKEAWGDKLAATEEMFQSRLNTFPEGTYVSIENNKIKGVVVTQLVNYNYNKFNFSWYKATDNGYIRKTHNPKGKIIYGVNLSVVPNAMRGTGTHLLETIGKLTIKLGLKAGMLGGRIPDYYKYKHIPVNEYIKKTIIVKNKKKLLDRELKFYKRAGLKIIKPIPNYINDPASLNYGVLLVWKNPFYFITKVLPFLKNILSNKFKIK